MSPVPARPDSGGRPEATTAAKPVCMLVRQQQGYVSVSARDDH